MVVVFPNAHILLNFIQSIATKPAELLESMSFASVGDGGNRILDATVDLR